MRRARSPRKSRLAVRNSRVHGRGLFATRRIRAGARLSEYTGERLSEAEIEARYGSTVDDPHTLLFQISDDTCLDASVGGSDARFINHSCRPNCESQQEGDRIFIFAIRNIQPGVELTYDYSLVIEPGYSAERGRIYACRCGAPRCRGTMLAPRRRA